MENTNCGEKGWMLVASFDMTVNGSKCPDGLDEGMYGIKSSDVHGRGHAAKN